MSDVLAELTAAGVAIWLDDLSRRRLRDGSFAALIRDKHVVGATTNPTIFQKALAEGDVYDEQLADLKLRGIGVEEAVRMVTTADVRDGCDALRAQDDGQDGRVSIEVDPRLAHDTERTIAEARQLWWLVDRPNLYIKIPATDAGLPAITQCIAEGIAINVTLIFGIERYRQVLEAWLAGLEQRHAAGLPLDVASVGSFFVSRIDTEVDHRLDLIAKESGDDARIAAAERLRGAAAIANARLAWVAYTDVVTSERWATLAAAGAHPQRPLWASTGVKDPAYDDTRYVVELVAPGTVNTMPEPTMDAVAEHGRLQGPTATTGVDEARAVFADLAEVGVDFADVIAKLEAEGVTKFVDSWTDLLAQVAAHL